MKQLLASLALVLVGFSLGECILHGTTYMRVISIAINLTVAVTLLNDEENKNKGAFA